ncbi:SCO family protein [Sphingosinicella rhizophila]|uniref:SCO family protein n=1 Tax=Sphingosinicella rhizophila TaxID=3050082 RepID=A0ABU3Q805_9SPHN|nr:SCO family protein [Sphingosinicella sp. GR2756]MDT9599540.1 SCO family protein [Sphingosinicella sp. GR2756]
MNEKAKSLILLAVSLLLGLALAACSPAAVEEPPLQGARIGGPFTLTDQNGRKVSDTDFAGRYRIVYFGFSYCPDVCPTDLLAIGQGLKRFEKKDPDRAAGIQPIFITVDPERDTPAVLKQYVASFHPRLIGLTGSAEDIAAVTKAFSIYYAKEQREDVTGYTMNHSRQTILFGPKGEPIAILPSDQGADAVAAELDRWVK